MNLTLSLQLLPSVLDDALRYSHLSHSMSSHLDSSPESSENGTDAPLTPKGKSSYALSSCAVTQLPGILHSDWSVEANLTWLLLRLMPNCIMSI